jgi:hypothetical protein
LQACAPGSARCFLRLVTIETVAFRLPFFFGGHAMRQTPRQARTPPQHQVSSQLHDFPNAAIVYGWLPHSSPSSLFKPVRFYAC